MSPNGGVTQSIATAKVTPPTFLKQHVMPTFSRRWNQAPYTPWGNYATTDAKHISKKHPAPYLKKAN